MEFVGRFETHITLDVDDSAAADQLQAFASEFGAKFVHIVLDRGRRASQPMLTTFGSGSLEDQTHLARRLAAELETRGFHVCRVKIETELDTPGIPRTDEKAAAAPVHRHFEFHVKLLLTTDADVPALTALAASHAARLSRNARRVRDDGRLERFVTQRCFAAGRSTAVRRLDALLSTLSDGGYTVLDLEQEYVVDDSNLSLDAGWIETPGDHE